MYKDNLIDIINEICMVNNQNNYIVGVTGGIGSGKSLITNLFISKGVLVIDADIISKNILTNNNLILKIIKNHFSSKILNKDGLLNRKYLRKIIFCHKKEKEWLNSLLHPIIFKEIKKKIKTHKEYPYIICVMPLLFENQREKLFNRILVIDSIEKEQINRVIKRDNTSSKDVKKIIYSQISRIERLNKANDVIENFDNKPFPYKEVDYLHEKYIFYSKKVI
ncbi:MAG: dephospho-CoA kinase [Arsenophonus sp.]|nr:MAG: dephospho-CoA kinase [Arsenophonus sp.]